MVGELNGILAWVEQLGEVDVTGVEPMTAVISNKLRLRDDVVTDGDVAGAERGALELAREFWDHHEKMTVPLSTLAEMVAFCDAWTTYE